jgi:hypothetical protein
MAEFEVYVKVNRWGFMWEAVSGDKEELLKSCKNGEKVYSADLITRKQVQQ